MNDAVPHFYHGLKMYWIHRKTMVSPLSCSSLASVITVQLDGMEIYNVGNVIIQKRVSSVRQSEAEHELALCFSAVRFY